MRISRPARATRATPRLPKRVSRLPSTRSRMTAPRGVPAAVGRCRRPAWCPSGPGGSPPRRRPARARAERDGDDAVPPQVGSGTPLSSRAAREGRRVVLVRVAADGERRRAVGLDQQPGDAAADAEHGAVDRRIGAERQVGAAVGQQPDDDRDVPGARAARGSRCRCVHDHRAELGAGRAGEHVAEARAEARVDLPGRQQPERDEARRAVGERAACRRRRSGRRGRPRARARRRASCRAARGRPGRRCRTGCPACRSGAAGRRRTGRPRHRRRARGCRRSP